MLFSHPVGKTPHVRGCVLASGAALMAAMVLLALWPGLAHAHIKWFNPQFNLMLPPRSVAQVLSQPLFLPLLAAAALALFMGALADRRLWHWRPLRRQLQAMDAWCARMAYPFLRCAIGLFFAVLAWEGQVMLTPDSPASATWVSSLQWLIALGAPLPAAGVAAGVGILLLYGMCIDKLGLFHMLDYPAFIGAAMLLIVPAVRRDLAMRSLMVLRALTALSLMVGAAEKFGYPQWSFDLLRHHPVLTFGVSDLEFYMMGAGMVEFALAYLILVGNVSARVAALLMFGLMGSAITLFGWVDAVGHALFLAALLALAMTRNPLESYFHLHGRHGRVLSAALVSVVFVIVVIEAVCLYRLANIQLVTLCTTTPQGVHLHR